MPENQDVVNSQTSTLQQMSTTMAKEACRKLYLQVKTLDREKSALETLSQSLNEENNTLKKLNESLTKNIDSSNCGMLYRNAFTCINARIFHSVTSGLLKDSGAGYINV